MQEAFNREKYLRYAQVFFRAHLLNFALFVIITLAIGGTGLLGHEHDGRFFVGQHGHYVEVSRGIYDFSKIYTAYTIVMIVVTLIGSFVPRKIDASRIKLSLAEWAAASIIPLLWLLLFLIIRF